MNYLAPLLHGGITNFLWIVLSFLVVLTVLVFVHELGHYLIARYNRVRIDVFSIGFGPELFGWNDRAGTRWKFSAIPLGGYVKMFGDSDPSSALASADLAEMTPEERAASFHHKRLRQRAAIVGGGPLANFLFAIVVLALLFATHGQPVTPAEIGSVLPGSAAEKAGIKVGDVIVTIDGVAISRFEDLKKVVSLNRGSPISITVKRDGQLVTMEATPTLKSMPDRFGFQHEYGQLGVSGSKIEFVKRNPGTAVVQAFDETWNMSSGTLEAIWQIIIGIRSSDELGGPLRIAQMSGQVAKDGPMPLLWFMAVLSINLGLINLFPVPVLDGGHLLFYAAEAIRGKPLGQKAQEYGFRIGLALVLTLMVFATWNDIVHWLRSS